MLLIARFEWINTAKSIIESVTLRLDQLDWSVRALEAVFVRQRSQCSVGDPLGVVVGLVVVLDNHGQLESVCASRHTSSIARAQAAALCAPSESIESVFVVLEIARENSRPDKGYVASEFALVDDFDECRSVFVASDDHTTRFEEGRVACLMLERKPNRRRRDRSDRLEGRRTSRCLIGDDCETKCVSIQGCRKRGRIDERMARSRDDEAVKLSAGDLALQSEPKFVLVLGGGRGDQLSARATPASATHASSASATSAP